LKTKLLTAALTYRRVFRLFAQMKVFLLLLGQRYTQHFCRIFGVVASLLARSETAAGIFPRSRLARKSNFTPTIVAYPAALAVLCVSALFWSGCAHSEKGKGAAQASKGVAPISMKTAARPLTNGVGVILSVSDSLHFVVIDFSAGQIPPLDTRLSVYRGGQKVAELKVSGPVRNSNVVADIRAGEVKAGDEVRVD
jgi:hypothetical protein